ncbi:nucleoside phosphorylase [Candidatus Woesearchaeota archaeon]|jgi:uridine phosphorylase|nr:nucleoside phosphorylase [Candidatus Woesearchaeota archaeon]
MNEIPILDNNPYDEDIITPEDEYMYELKFSHKKQYPDACFIFFQKELFNSFVDGEKLILVETLLGQYEFYELIFNKHKCGVIVFGIGAPLSSLLFERLIVRGVKRFITVGISGSISEGNAGDIYLCDKSIRDEGVSYHYEKASKYAYPSGSLNNKIKDFFKSDNIFFKEGISWTTDAGYKESKKKAEKYRKEGTVCIDMESAALFTIAKYRDVQVSSIFILSDFVDKNFNWVPKFHEKEIIFSCKKIKTSLIKALK